MTKQVKSKQRVADHGEVFTAEREVKAMCDLVKTETERIDSRFLEPACGDGNFLAEILSRKLAVVKKKYKKFPMDYEKSSVLAVSSLYGVDILQDNCEACRERLYRMWDKEYKAVCKKEVSEDCRRSRSSSIWVMGPNRNFFISTNRMSRSTNTQIICEFRLRIIRSHPDQFMKISRIPGSPSCFPNGPL